MSGAQVVGVQRFVVLHASTHPFAPFYVWSIKNAPQDALPYNACLWKHQLRWLFLD